MQIKLIFTRKVVHLVSFWKWGFWELGSGLLTSEVNSTCMWKYTNLDESFHHRPREAMGIFPKDLPTFTWKEVDVSGRILCPMWTTVAVFKEIIYWWKTWIKTWESSHNLIKCFFFHLVLLAQCALFAEISTHQEERQSTLKYS